MPNVRDKKYGPGRLDEAQRRYVDDYGQMFARYGSSLTVGRLFALLLVSDEPRGLDDIAQLIGVSKSGASVAARDLERLGIVRRHGTTGSRRIVYEATDDMLPIFEATIARIREGLSMARQGDPLLTRGPAQTRLRTIVELYEFWLKETEDTMERWRQPGARRIKK